MAFDANQKREDDLINQIRVLYGIEPTGARASDIDRQMFEVQHGRDLLRVNTPETITRPNQRDPRHAGTVIANPAFRRGMDELNAREKDLLRQRSGVTITDDQRLQATQNRELMEGVFHQTRQASLAEGGSQLDDRFGQTLRLHRARSGASGMTGGSADASGRRRMLTDLFKGRQSLRRGADAADTSSRNSVNDRRMELERQVKLGTAPDVGSIRALDAQAQDVDEAYRNLPQLALGNLFATGGDIYRDTTEAGAYGRRGGNAFALTSGRTAPARGSYT